MFLMYDCPHMEVAARPGRLGPSAWLPESCWDAREPATATCFLTGRECEACMADEPWQCGLRERTDKLCPCCWEDCETARLDKTASGWLICREDHCYQNKEECLKHWQHIHPTSPKKTVHPASPLRIIVTITDSDSRFLFG